MYKKSILKVIVTIVVALAFLAPTSSVFANDEGTLGNTIVSIDPATQTVMKGTSFDVEVYIEPGEPVCGVEIYKIYYNENVITATGVTYEEFFDPYATMTMPHDLSVPGVISGIGEFTIDTSTVTDSNVFCTISFTADNVGNSVIDLEEVDITRPDATSVPLVVNDGEVIVTSDEFYILDISVDGLGTTDPTPGTHTYPESTIVDLEAIPEPGWSFDHWDGDIADPNSAITNITMNDDEEVTAYFTEDHYILNVSTVGSGHVDVVPDKEFYLYCDEPELTAVADSGWTFDSWSGDLSGDTNPTTIFMDDDKNVTATFTDIDEIPPHTEIHLNGTMGDNGWYVSCVTVTLVATDEGSGVESTWYRVDGVENWKFYHIPFEVCKEGYHIVEAYSFDHAGNKEVPKIVEFKIDTKPPVTTHSFDGDIGNDGWFVSDVTVTLSARDVTSGVNYTKYRLDDGEWTNYTVSFNVTENGEYTLCYYSVDLAGNNESVNEVGFKIEKDLIPPVTTHEFGGIIGDNGWYTSDVRVTLTAVDDSSGVDCTVYKLEDDTEWQEYTGQPILVTEDGEHNITYFSVDKVGNIEGDKGPFEFNIDKTSPTIVLDAEGSGSIWLLKADVSDETSGIAKVEFYANGEYLGDDTESPYEWECTGVRKGDKAQAIVYDKAGNLKISNEKKGKSQGWDTSIGWTFLIGWISNVEEAENIITAQAIRLYYIEISSTGINVGFVKMKSVEFNSHNLLGRRMSRSFGQMSPVIGIFKGGITIEGE